MAICPLWATVLTMLTAMRGWAHIQEPPIHTQAKPICRAGYMLRQGQLWERFLALRPPPPEHKHTPCGGRNTSPENALSSDNLDDSGALRQKHDPDCLVAFPLLFSQSPLPGLLHPLIIHS